MKEDIVDMTVGIIMEMPKGESACVWGHRRVTDVIEAGAKALGYEFREVDETYGGTRVLTCLLQIKE